ncbi:prolyl oligopeptidase family serine peptidase [bacterium]|nr:prolyl oligopeptidase family serine peptidase [bacterium]
MKLRMKIIPLLFLVLSLSFPLMGQKGDDKTSSSEWTVDDVINQKHARDFKISPEGSWVLWVKSLPHQKKDQRLQHIFLTSLEKEETSIQLTRGNKSEHSPQWAPSGKYISFLSSRKDQEDKGESSGSQLWLMHPQGGEPWELTHLPFGIKQYEWIDDNQILLLTREKRTLREKKKKERKDTSRIVEDQAHMKPWRLFVFNVKKEKLIRLTENDDQITRFVLSHDKKWVLTRNKQSVRFQVDHKIKPKFYLMNRKEKSKVELFPDPKFKPNMLAWALNDKGFYFSVTQTSDYEHGGPGADFLYYFDLQTREYHEVPLDWNWGLFYLGFQVRKNGFVTSLANGTCPKWRRYFKNGSSYTYKELKGKHYPHIYNLTLQPQGKKAVYQFSTASQPAQWYTGILEGNSLPRPRKIIDLNSHLNPKTKARTEIITWTGAKDDEIEGILYYPHDYEKGKRYPLILMIHGGPTGVDMDRFDESWATYPNLMCQKGAFVLKANYHGSGGYGQEFAESIKGHYYEYEIQDFLRGIDSLIKKGLVHPDKLAAMGWSNGGILTVALSVWTDRFKTAGVGAADVNWISDYGNCAFGVSFDNYYFKGPFWKELDHYIEKSPIFDLENMKVPTIIFHGTEDRSVPYEQGWEYYRALQQIGKAPVRFIVFPDQPHGLQKLTHQLRKMKEEINWFEKYFFKTTQAENEAFKENSPLDLILKKSQMRKVHHFYGKKYKDYLLPETVQWGQLKVGRFEVTRAQWASYDKDYQYKSGTGNYPVSGISFHKAQQYVDWLSQMTGETYRLPLLSEAKKLAQLGDYGNTLDYWAGYSINPDDAQLLLQKLHLIKGKAPLLLPVDRFPPTGKENFFGLKGNVSEWSVDHGNDGKALGLNALTPQDASCSYDPPLEYTGLRVVKEKSKGNSR